MSTVSGCTTAVRQTDTDGKKIKKKKRQRRQLSSRRKITLQEERVPTGSHRTVSKVHSRNAIVGGG